MHRNVTDQQEAQEREQAELGTSCMKSLQWGFSLPETFVCGVGR